MRLYLAGPMSGLPLSNYPAFDAAAAQLRAQGFEVENPAENQRPACGTWLGYMRLSIQQIARCEALVMLPDWEKSRGATIERRLAADLGLPVLTLRAALSFSFAGARGTESPTQTVASGAAIGCRTELMKSVGGQRA